MHHIVFTQNKIIKKKESIMPVKGKHLLHYVPHGINPKTFFPVEKENSLLKSKRKSIEDITGKKYDFVVFYNSRNIKRKHTSNIILAYRMFCDNLTKEQASKCLLLMHTEVKMDAGTDLIAVKEAMCPDYDIIFSPNKILPEEMNLLYNIADVTVNASSNEGFGLSTAESLMAGTPIIITMTGGLQDQSGQTDDDGNPVKFTKEFGSNSCKKYSNVGPWVYPVWPVCRDVQGSVPTPYIFDDMTRWEDFAEGMMYWYLMGDKKRTECGKKGREWALGDGNINSKHMCDEFIKAMDYTLENFEPVKQFGLYTANDYVGHTMPDNCMGFEIPKIDKESLKQKSESLII